MIRSLHYANDGALRADLALEAVAAVQQSAEGLLWLDLCGEPPAQCEPILRDVFGFHPLAVDDALAESHHPKIDDWGDYLLVVLHGVVFDGQNEPQVRTQELQNLRNTRSKQIGMLKAIGASAGDVFRLIWLETLLTCIAGGVAGVAVAIGAARGVVALLARMLPHVPTGLSLGFSWDAAGLCLLVAVVLGLAAGAWPSYRASSVSPMEAIRGDLT